MSYVAVTKTTTFCITKSNVLTRLGRLQKFPERQADNCLSSKPNNQHTNFSE